MLTAQNSSSSNDLSCLTLQMQMAMEIMLTNMSGTKTMIHKCLGSERDGEDLEWSIDSMLSANMSSNMRSRRWVAKLMSIALYWMYSSVLSRLWGSLHHTKDPTMAPLMTIIFHNQMGMKTDHQDTLRLPSSFRVNSNEKHRREEYTTNFEALKSWKRDLRLTSPLPGILPIELWTRYQNLTQSCFTTPSLSL